MLLTHRPVAEKDIQRICGFPQTEDELYFLFPKATFPLSASQLQEAIAQRSDSTVVELDGEVVAFANFHAGTAGGAPPCPRRPAGDPSIEPPSPQIA